MNVFLSTYLAVDQIAPKLVGNQGKPFAQRWLSQWWNRLVD